MHLLLSEVIHDADFLKGLLSLFFLPGPVQSQLMPSADGRGYSPSVPGSYPHQTPAKVPPHHSSGQYSYSGSQNVSQLNNYQGPGQTLNRPPVAPFSGSPVQQTGPVPPVLPAALQTSAALSSAGSFPPGASPPVLSNWPYSQTPVSQAAGAQTSHLAHVAGTGSTQPPSSLSGNTNPPGNYQYAPSPGGPPLQNSYMKPGNCNFLVSPHVRFLVSFLRRESRTDSAEVVCLSNKVVKADIVRNRTSRVPGWFLWVRNGSSVVVSLSNHCQSLANMLKAQEAENCCPWPCCRPAAIHSGKIFSNTKQICNAASGYYGDTVHTEVSLRQTAGGCYRGFSN